MNEGLIGSICSLLDLSLSSTSLLTTMLIGISIGKIKICKGMLSKHVPPLSGPIGLVMAIGCTTNGVVGILLLVPISTNTKLGGLYLKSRSWFGRHAAQVGNFVH